ncbi:hypothetical protein EMCRGX_G031154 [Ephydatia muelleri]
MTLKGTVQVNSKDIGAMPFFKTVRSLPKEEEDDDDDQELFWDWAREKGIPDHWRWVPFLVGVYLRQPGTQRHARIRKTGGVTTTTKYFQAHQWRWVQFLVGVYLRQPGTQRHARIQNTGGVTTTKVGVYLHQPGTQRHAWIWNTGGVTTTNKYLQSDQWRWVPFLVGVYLRQPGTQRHARIQNTGGVTTTNKSFSSANQGPNVTRGFGTLGV